MPTGVVQWLDPTTGEARVLGNGQRYSASIESIDSRARHVGARVHFDVDHDAAGDVATEVVLREGTRVSPRQRRFGDLVGARDPETKVPTSSTVGSQGPHGTDAMHVARRWAEHLGAGELDDAAREYAPTATLHTEGDVAVGPDRIRARLAASPLLGAGAPASFEGEGAGDVVCVRWPVTDADGDAIESHIVVEHGEIAEQWQGPVRTLIDLGGPAPRIDLSSEGDVPVRDREYAIDKVRKVLATTGETVFHVTVRLEQLRDPARERPHRARASVDLESGAVRAHVRGHTMREAIDLLQDRLAERLRTRANHLRALRRRGTSSETGEWRHGDWRPAAPPEPIAPDERAVVRRPTWSADLCTFDEAVFDLESLDLDFLLFTDLASGTDAVVSRRPNGTYAVRFADPTDTGQRTASVAAIEFDPTPTPRLSIEEAREHLDRGGESWVFFRDLVGDRGHVLYRRVDGHDGLIVPRVSARRPASA